MSPAIYTIYTVGRINTMQECKQLGHYEKYIMYFLNYIMLQLSTSEKAYLSSMKLHTHAPPFR